MKVNLVSSHLVLDTILANPHTVTIRDLCPVISDWENTKAHMEMLAEETTVENIAKLIIYLHRFPVEYRIVYMKKLLALNLPVRQTPEFKAEIAEMSKFVLLPDEYTRINDPNVILI